MCHDISYSVRQAQRIATNVRPWSLKNSISSWYYLYSGEEIVHCSYSISNLVNKMQENVPDTGTGFIWQDGLLVSLKVEPMHILCMFRLIPPDVRSPSRKKEAHFIVYVRPQNHGQTFYSMMPLLLL